MTDVKVAVLLARQFVKICECGCGEPTLISKKTTRFVPDSFGERGSRRDGCQGGGIAG